ncbi:hypothetical protein EJB05_10522, partial [Eragrostis curvula]
MRVSGMVLDPAGAICQSNRLAASSRMQIVCPRCLDNFNFMTSAKTPASNISSSTGNSSIFLLCLFAGYLGIHSARLEAAS